MYGDDIGASDESGGPDARNISASRRCWHARRLRYIMAGEPQVWRRWTLYAMNNSVLMETGP
jgi:hypothetical protein